MLTWASRDLAVVARVQFFLHATGAPTTDGALAMPAIAMGTARICIVKMETTQTPSLLFSPIYKGSMPDKMYEHVCKVTFSDARGLCLYWCYYYMQEQWETESKTIWSGNASLDETHAVISVSRGEKGRRGDRFRMGYDRARKCRRSTEVNGRGFRNTDMDHYTTARFKGMKEEGKGVDRGLLEVKAGRAMSGNPEVMPKSEMESDK
ncbi:hypothetical protein K438DRAFT_1941516 [Mycena galopus ATCC 62051]|nr:hypothetical protein K438DRAFT_1941516 [Mycena galopus ATCC 62051]